MGITFTKLFQRLFSKKEMRILMVCPVPRGMDRNSARPPWLTAILNAAGGSRRSR